MYLSLRPFYICIDLDSSKLSELSDKLTRHLADKRDRIDIQLKANFLYKSQASTWFVFLKHDAIFMNTDKFMPEILMSRSAFEKTHRIFAAYTSW